jgi:hypothetical protein
MSRATSSWRRACRTCSDSSRSSELDAYWLAAETGRPASSARLLGGGPVPPRRSGPTRLSGGG